MTSTVFNCVKGLSAYIDPASTSILLTSITAIAVAIGATFIILWRKFKKGVSKALHIDPNAGKEVEDDLVVNDSAEDNVAAEASDSPTEAQEEVQAEQAQEAQAQPAEKEEKEE